MWEQSSFPEVVAKTKTKPSVGEEQAPPRKLRSTGVSITYSKCKLSGHNEKTCKAPPDTSVKALDNIKVATSKRKTHKQVIMNIV